MVIVAKQVERVMVVDCADGGSATEDGDHLASPESHNFWDFRRVSAHVQLNLMVTNAFFSTPNLGCVVL